MNGDFLLVIFCYFFQDGYLSLNIPYLDLYPSDHFRFFAPIESLGT